MENRCSNCGQVALKTDSVCWHCGKPLPWYKENTAQELRVKEGWGKRGSASSVIIYGVATVTVIGLLFIVMSSLASRPTVQISLGTRPAEGWMEVTTSDLGLTTYLPEAWRWYDAANDSHFESLVAEIDKDESFRAGLLPLGGAIDDLEFRFLAKNQGTSGDIPTAFMVVATSRKLNRLSYEEASLYLDEGDFPISELRFVDNFDKSYLSIVTEPEDVEGDRNMRCRQQFIKGENSGMLFALCAPTSVYSAQQVVFEEIWKSFQRLS